MICRMDFDMFFGILIFENSFYKSFIVVLCKKTARKNTKYSRNETILKIDHHAKAIGWPIFKMVSFLEYLVFFRAVFCTEQL